MLSLERVAQGQLRIQPIVVPPADSLVFQIPLGFEFLHDPLGCAFRDPHRIRHVSEPHRRVARDADQHMRVVCQKGPLGGLLHGTLFRSTGVPRQFERAISRTRIYEIRVVLCQGPATSAELAARVHHVRDACHRSTARMYDVL